MSLFSKTIKLQNLKWKKPNQNWVFINSTAGYTECYLPASVGLFCQDAKVSKPAWHAWKIPVVDSPQRRSLAGPEQIQRSSFQKSDRGNSSSKLSAMVSVHYLPEEKNQNRPLKQPIKPTLEFSGMSNFTYSMGLGLSRSHPWREPGCTNTEGAILPVRKRNCSFHSLWSYSLSFPDWEVRNLLLKWSSN